MQMLIQMMVHVVWNGVDPEALVASLVAAVSQGAVTVNGCADGLPTLNGLLGVECSTDMSVYTTELPAGQQQVIFVDVHVQIQ